MTVEDFLMASADISVALQKLLKGAEEDIAGNYFKPVRANKLIAQAHETQRAVSKWKGTISYRQTCHVKGSTIFHGNFQNMQRWCLLLAPSFQMNKPSESTKNLDAFPPNIHRQEFCLQRSLKPPVSRGEETI